MACIQCGAESLFDEVCVCPDCATIKARRLNYSYDDDEETVTCGECGETNSLYGAPSIVNDDIRGGWDALLWRCPNCAVIFDLGE